MRTLYLVRHSKADLYNSFGDDFGRILNERGIMDAKTVGDKLKSENISLDYFISSPANRAYSTAKIIASKIKFKIDLIEKINSIYKAKTDDLIFILKNIKNNIQSLMMVGHNPGLTEFINIYTNSRIDNLPPSGVVKLRVNTDWYNIESEKLQIKKIFLPTYLQIANNEQ